MSDPDMILVCTGLIMYILVGNSNDPFAMFQCTAEPGWVFVPSAEAVSREMKNQECEVSGLEWLPADEAIRAMTYDTDKEVLAHAVEYLGRKHGLNA